MEWLILALGVTAAAGVLLELVRRRRERRDGPYLVQQLREWDRTSPKIQALDLPPVRQLKAKPMADGRSLVAWFKGRLN